jgi:hypothetical protein
MCCQCNACGNLYPGRESIHEAFNHLPFADLEFGEEYDAWELVRDREREEAAARKRKREEAAARKREEAAARKLKEEINARKWKRVEAAELERKKKLVIYMNKSINKHMPKQPPQTQPLQK